MEIRCREGRYGFKGLRSPTHVALEAAESPNPESQVGVSDLPPPQPVGEVPASVARLRSCCFSLQRKAE